MKKITFPHRSRAEQIEYITGVGGYSEERSRWPISFNVKCYASCDFDTLWNKYNRQYLDKTITESPERMESFYQCVKEAHKTYGEDRLWRIGIEDARRAIDESEAYSNMPYCETKVSVKFAFAGRSGGHLVIEEFEGHSLRGLRDDDLLFYMRMQSRDDVTSNESDTLRKGWEWTHWTTEDVRKLYKFVRACEVWFSRQSVETVVQENAATVLFSLAEDQYYFELKSSKEHNDLINSAKVVFEGIYADAIGGLLESKGDKGSELLWAFEDLTKAAGIKEEELHALSQHILPLCPRS